MTDFLRYVVNEVKQQRLDQRSAAKLLQQFAAGKSGIIAEQKLHPLLHRNISDLYAFSFVTTLSVDDFFLKDHQVRGICTLPAAAYLEMIRAGLCIVLGELDTDEYWQLQDLVWPLPFQVETHKTITLHIVPGDDHAEQFAVQVTSQDGQCVHCSGRAVLKQGMAPRTELEAWSTLRTEGLPAVDALYQRYAQMGLAFGPGHRAISQLRAGQQCIWAELSLPTLLVPDADRYGLHPSLLDGALQAVMGLFEQMQLALPYALERMSIYRHLPTQLKVRLSFSAGYDGNEVETSVDVAFYDDQGTLCVQLTGFRSRRLLASVATPTAELSQAKVSQTLMATPQWVELAATAPEEQPAAKVLLLDLPSIQAEHLAAQLGSHQVTQFQPDPQLSRAENFTALALHCFEFIQQWLQQPDAALVQIVVRQEYLLTALAGLLRSAEQENPSLCSQLICTQVTDAVSLAQQLRAESGAELAVLLQGTRRLVYRLTPLASTPLTEASPYRAEGVYLITGGLGAIGVLFALDILQSSAQTRVILTGRRVHTEVASVLASQFKAFAGRVEYVQLDLMDAAQVQTQIAELTERFGGIHGIVHCAGMLADNFLQQKNKAEFIAVLAPKVQGTIHLDLATRQLNLDWLLLCSSGAAVLGNLGQSDYAVANGFMDAYATYRRGVVKDGQAKGQTLSINWPLWQQGGMQLAEPEQRRLLDATGLVLLSTQAAFVLFRQALQSGEPQVLVAEGHSETMRRTLFVQHGRLGQSPRQAQSRPTEVVITAELLEFTQEYLRQKISGVLKIPAHQLDPQAAMQDYGMDSILAMDLTQALEQYFSPLPKTLFFEYQTLAALTRYVAAQFTTAIKVLMSPPRQSQIPAVQPEMKSEMARTLAATEVAAGNGGKVLSKRQQAKSHHATSTLNRRVKAEPIAIIGMSGRYPQAENLAAYWQNLRDGVNCITEIPLQRWDWRDYLHADRQQQGYHFSKWGGFIDGVDAFEPLFFNIAPIEAQKMDPQERLFLEHTWLAMEDAGLNKAALQIPRQDDLAGQVGVYAGVMYSEYQLLGVEASLQGHRTAFACNPAGIANRVSYVLNLHGPSMTVDTMCSSSLTAMHLACRDLRAGVTDMAIAGGVNVTIHPNKYTLLSEGQFISSEGQCQSFGIGGDGYIPGEGVGVLILQRLSDAQRDGRLIYATITGSAINHGGKTNGVTVPNPLAQSSVIQAAIQEAGIDPRQISYIEAHGTGTKLGDPIEISGLTRVFHARNQDKQYCKIGSAKSNIGHCESAAGVAGVSKVLLQMRHGQIAPSLHSTTLNPHIRFAESPFDVNQQLIPWQRPVIDGIEYPRIAGISSFGAGGANAHLIIEEYRAASSLDPVSGSVDGSCVLLLSARTQASLRQKVADLLEYSHTATEGSLADIAFTLQVGREHMLHRLAFECQSITALQTTLTAWVDDTSSSHHVFSGVVDPHTKDFMLINQDEDMQKAVDNWLLHKKFGKLMELWVRGLAVDWTKLYRDQQPRLVRLPLYPFSKERCWFSPPASVLPYHESHPLLQQNKSNFVCQRYVTRLTGREYFLQDHQIQFHQQLQKILPAAVYIEMLLAAMRDALPAEQQQSALALTGLSFQHPLLVAQAAVELRVTLHPASEGEFIGEIESGPEDDSLHHCHALIHACAEDLSTIDLAQLQQEILEQQYNAADCYQQFTELGLSYGPSFRCIQQLAVAKGQVIASIQCAASEIEAMAGYHLPPTLLDAALQTSIGFSLSEPERKKQSGLPYAIAQLRLLRPCSAEMWVWSKLRATEPQSSVVQLDLQMFNAQGELCVDIEGLTLKSQAPFESQAISTLCYQPSWHTQALTVQAQSAIPQHLVVTYGVAAALPGLTQLPIAIDETTDVARQYQSFAVAMLSILQQQLRAPDPQALLLQVVVQHPVHTGIVALLKAAQQEHPSLTVQVIELEPSQLAASPEQAGMKLETLLLKEKVGQLPPLVRYRQQQRQVQSWQYQGELQSAPLCYKSNGIYLITGGLGGLGLLVATDILQQCPHAQVVLTGRRPLDATITQQIANLAASDRVHYHATDISDPDHVTQLMAQLHGQFGRLDGVFHSAGVLKDAMLLEKSASDFTQVLLPKVAGTWHLINAAKPFKPDFIALFSSTAVVAGVHGQTDYCAANGFMDAYVDWLAQTQDHEPASPLICSINWPYWQEGGMQMDEQWQRSLTRTTGLIPLSRQNGLMALQAVLAAGATQQMILQGHATQIKQSLATMQQPAADVLTASTSIISAQPATAQSAVRVGITANSASHAVALGVAVIDWLKTAFSGVLRMAVTDIHSGVALEHYGIDSVLAIKLTQAIEAKTGPQSKSLLFEYKNITALADYLVKHHAGALQSLLPTTAPQKTQVLAATTSPQLVTSSLKFSKLTTVTQTQRLKTSTAGPEQIAIIGLAGRYPGAADLAGFWQNLLQGKDCITEIPASRWNLEQFFTPSRDVLGKSYCKWGGFLADIDQFDAQFFHMSPREAALIDPQERLFLETAWQTIEDAGYNKSSLAGSATGVYVGVMWGQYEMLAIPGQTPLTSSSYASVANRVSYVLDLQGPSMAVDTMCSSSLTAIHLAMSALRHYEINAAIAGGVNLTIHPYKYLNLSQSNFQSSDGRCRSFGMGGDGYVSGEGVGAVMLKRLADAEQDGDHIYAVLLASALNHGGKTNGYSVPNPVAQGALVADALQKSGIPAQTISYIETHGTGTSLGDPIEINGLQRAFADQADPAWRCPIGSVKSNIGHLEAAAGIAALTKVLLQMKHQTLVPSLHAEKTNPHINFAATPFYVQQQAALWPRGDQLPLRASISSFGAGGANAHLIVQDYLPAANNQRPELSKPRLVVLSARNRAQLLQSMQNLVGFLVTEPSCSLRDVAYSLQVGRTAQVERLSIQVCDLTELQQALHNCLVALPQQQSLPKGCLHGVCQQAADTMDLSTLPRALATQDLATIATLWLQGAEPQWQQLYGDETPRRISLPTYPFQRQRHWLAFPAPAATQAVQANSTATVTTTVTNKSQSAELPAATSAEMIYFSQSWQITAFSALDDRANPAQSLLWLENQPSSVLMPTGWIRGSQGDVFERVSVDHFVLPLTDPAAVSHFIQQLSDEQRLPTKVVFHIAFTGAKAGMQQLLLMQAVYQAFATNRINTPLQWICLTESHAQDIAAQALSGWFLSLQAENPLFRGLVLSYEPGMPLPSLLHSEYQQTDATGCQVRYRYQGATLVREIALLQPTRLEQANTELNSALGETQTATVKQGGVYLVSGGLGGLGGLFADYLRTAYHANVVLFGRRAETAEIRQSVQRFAHLPGELRYVQADVSILADMQQLVVTTIAHFGRIDGVFHSAGLHQDSLIQHKSVSSATAVLQPKVLGCNYLDLATSSLKLDLFLLFSSVAAVVGNAGQTDYAYANCYLDCFAKQRQQAVLLGHRHGKTLSINWPYWQEGGMKLTADQLTQLASTTGLQALPTALGLQAFEAMLQANNPATVLVYGDRDKIHQVLAARAQPTPSAYQSADWFQSLASDCQQLLCQFISEETELALADVEPSAHFDTFGLDSMMINRLNNRLSQVFGDVPKTLFYEQANIVQLSAFLQQHHASQLRQHFAPSVAPSIVPTTPELGAMPTMPAISAPNTLLLTQAPQTPAKDSIAIVGLHGWFPQAASRSEFWQHLVQGADLVTQVPSDRWDAEHYFDPNPAQSVAGKIYCKWGGFLSGVDLFDAGLFNISADEAKLMDPQERLFLQSVWLALEDAGYAPQLSRGSSETMQPGVGVFVGVTSNTYQMIGPDEWHKQNMVAPASMPWSIANRVSYFFNWTGPSLPVDTACSSSLVALHMACESLHSQQCAMAIAGGVNLYLHPSKYHALCQRQMLAAQGRCRSFGSGDDGFVPAECVGSLVLKRMVDAIADGDHIHAEILATGFAHAGRSHGYSAPNLQAQVRLIQEVIGKAQLRPDDVSYVEAHGTGTQLGDTLEIEALKTVFGCRQTQSRCAIGSVKSNMGHAESAAGIAALTKVILQLQQQTLVPSLHCEAVNPHIDFASSAFELQTQTAPWQPLAGQPRRALINSFGAGGVNAAVVLQEVVADPHHHATEWVGPGLFVLSAQSNVTLTQYVARMRDDLSAQSQLNLQSVCYTLLTGRQAMPHRIAVVAADLPALIAALTDWLNSGTGSAVYQGEVRKGKRPPPTMLSDDLHQSARLWCQGAELHWATPKPQKVSLVGYPFALQRYWVTDEPMLVNSITTTQPAVSAATALHPLLSKNSSTLSCVSFTSELDQSAICAHAHQIMGQVILPATGFAEMVAASASLAAEKRVACLSNVIWLQPLVLQQEMQITKTLLKPLQDVTEFEVISYDEDYQVVVHCEGQVGFEHGPFTAPDLNIKQLLQNLPRSRQPDDYYHQFAQFGLVYGTAYQSIKSYHYSDNEAVAMLQLDPQLQHSISQYLIHPVLFDGALQAVAGLMPESVSCAYLPYAVDQIDIYRPLVAVGYVWVQKCNTASHFASFDILLTDIVGVPLVKLTNLAIRPIQMTQLKLPVLTSTFDFEEPEHR